MKMAEWTVYGAYGTKKKFRIKKEAQKYAKGDIRSRVVIKTKRTRKGTPKTRHDRTSKKGKVFSAGKGVPKPTKSKSKITISKQKLHGKTQYRVNNPYKEVLRDFRTKAEAQKIASGMKKYWES